MHGVPVISNALISVFEDLEANKNVQFLSI